MYKHQHAHLQTMSFKGIYLSKALTCMNIFLYKKELLFCQGDGYLYEQLIYLTQITVRPNVQLLSKRQHV